MTLLETLKKLNEARTPGPWGHRFGDKGNIHGVYFGPKTEQFIASMIGSRGNYGKEEEWANSEWIVAFANSAEAILEVLEAAQQLHLLKRHAPRGAMGWISSVQDFQTLSDALKPFTEPV